MLGRRAVGEGVDIDSSLFAHFDELLEMQFVRVGSAIC